MTKQTTCSYCGKAIEDTDEVVEYERYGAYVRSTGQQRVHRHTAHVECKARANKAFSRWAS